MSGKRSLDFTQIFKVVLVFLICAGVVFSLFWLVSRLSESLVTLYLEGRTWAAGFLSVLIPVSVWAVSCAFLLWDLRAGSLRELAREPGQWRHVAMPIVLSPILMGLVLLGNLLNWLDGWGRQSRKVRRS